MRACELAMTGAPSTLVAGAVVTISHARAQALQHLFIQRKCVPQLPIGAA